MKRRLLDDAEMKKEKDTAMSSNTGKKSFWGSFAITDQDSCAKAIKSGGIAAMLSATVTGAFAISAFFTSSSDKTLNYFLDPWLLVDLILILVIGFFIFRKSRVAATLMVIYFVGSKLLIWIDLGEPKGLVMSIILLFFYVTAMRGTYIWHSKYHNSPFKPTA
jgi:hypothetical protein